ncbi:MAG: polysaccharide biosynthesis protein [Nocardioides sp.]|jgi:O-antigen/teichoic acid export membrane protein
MSPRPSTLLASLRGSAGVALAMVVMNVTTYGFTFVAVYLLGPREYGITASLMGMFTVASVLSLGLQATAARHVAAATAERRHLEHKVHALSWWCALLVFALCCAVIPLADRFLRIGDPVAVLLVGFAVAPLTVVGGQAGVLQGGRHWSGLALVYLATGIPRLVIGAAFIALSPTAVMSMAGVAVAAWVPVLVGSLVLRTTTQVRTATIGEDPEVATTELGMLSEIMHNSHALVVFFLLSTVDVLLARATFDAHTAGLYAGGAIVAKMVMFLPSFIVVLAFPSMARTEDGSRVHLQALAAVGAVGGAAIAGTWLLPDLVLVFAGGQEFVEIRALLPWFATIGTLLAMLQLMVYHVVARQLRATVWLFWLTVAAICALATQVSSLGSLVRGVALIEALLLMVLLGISLIRREGATLRTAQEASALSLA